MKLIIIVKIVFKLSVTMKSIVTALICLVDESQQSTCKSRASSITKNEFPIAMYLNKARTHG